MTTKFFGKVCLVGAGPGDPELITLKGKRCLEAADVVFYDKLVHCRLLNFVSVTGIPFEIVPGVSSATAVPAYAGIPITHRAHASSVAFVTGLQSGTGFTDLDRGRRSGELVPRFGLV